MDVKTAMKAAGLGNTFQKMTLSALQKAISHADRAGEDFIKRGRFVAPLATVKAVLARVKGRAVAHDPHPAGEDATEGDEGLEIERDPMPDTPKGYVTGDRGGPGGQALFARDGHQGKIPIQRDGEVSDGTGNVAEAVIQVIQAEGVEGIKPVEVVQGTDGVGGSEDVGRAEGVKHDGEVQQAGLFVI